MRRLFTWTAAMMNGAAQHERSGWPCGCEARDSFFERRIKIAMTKSTVSSWLVMTGGRSGRLRAMNA